MFVLCFCVSYCDARSGICGICLLPETTQPLHSSGNLRPCAGVLLSCVVFSNSQSFWFQPLSPLIVNHGRFASFLPCGGWLCAQFAGDRTSWSVGMGQQFSRSSGKWQRRGLTYVLRVRSEGHKEKHFFKHWHPRSSSIFDGILPAWMY